MGFQILVFHLVPKLESAEHTVACTPLSQLEEDNWVVKPCTENTALFLFSLFQYLSLCIVLNLDQDLRKPFFTNPALLISLVLLLIFQLILLFDPALMHCHTLFDLVPLQTHTKWLLLLMIILNYLTS